MVFRQNKPDKPFHGCKEQQLQVVLNQWFVSELGQQFVEAEKQQLDAVLPNLFGFYLLQLGNPGEADLLSSSRVSHCRVVGLQSEPAAAFQAESWAMPIKSDSIDVVILPHTLDFARYPHEVLREVERILIPEGHIVIAGFNPLSLWQLWRWILGWRKQPPWCGHFFTQFRLRDWLTLLGFGVVNKKHFFYRPPIKNRQVMQRLRFMEKLGQRLWPITGAGYVLVARKRVVTLTPLRQKWQTRKQVVTGGLAESSVPHNENNEAMSD